MFIHEQKQFLGLIFLNYKKQPHKKPTDIPLKISGLILNLYMSITKV